MRFRRETPNTPRHPIALRKELHGKQNVAAVFKNSNSLAARPTFNQASAPVSGHVFDSCGTRRKGSSRRQDEAANLYENPIRTHAVLGVRVDVHEEHTTHVT